MERILIDPAMMLIDVDQSISILKLENAEPLEPFLALVMMETIRDPFGETLQKLLAAYEAKMRANGAEVTEYVRKT